MLKISGENIRIHVIHVILLLEFSEALIHQCSWTGSQDIWPQNVYFWKDASITILCPLGYALENITQ